MSRGYGRVQRAVLEALRDHDDEPPNYAVMGLGTADIARQVYHQGRQSFAPTPPSEMSAVSRALASLARDGLVTGHRSGGRWLIANSRHKS